MKNQNVKTFGKGFVWHVYGKVLLLLLLLLVVGCGSPLVVHTAFFKVGWVSKHPLHCMYVYM